MTLDLCSGVSNVMYFRQKHCADHRIRLYVHAGDIELASQKIELAFLNDPLTRYITDAPVDSQVYLIK